MTILGLKIICEDCGHGDFYHNHEVDNPECTFPGCQCYVTKLIKSMVCENCGHHSLLHNHEVDNNDCNFPGCQCDVVKLSEAVNKDMNSLMLQHEIERH
jgi:hypothetical protein